MNMLKETTAVLKQVEETSDTPVEVITDPSLPTYVAPGHDVGFDLSKEYETAQQLFSGRNG